jgi:hypothetical protein
LSRRLSISWAQKLPLFFPESLLATLTSDAPTNPVLPQCANSEEKSLGEYIFVSWWISKADITSTSVPAHTPMQVLLLALLTTATRFIPGYDASFV